MKKTYADVQTVRQGVTTLINIDEKAHCEGVIRHHEVCQCDICRDKTRDVLPLTNESNSTLSLPDTEARDVMGGKEPDTFFSQPLKLGSRLSVKVSMVFKIHLTHVRATPPKTYK